MILVLRGVISYPLTVIRGVTDNDSEIANEKVVRYLERITING